jgi:3-hydroxyethyl bacteriochlorophyllide a dehydrogenase
VPRAGYSVGDRVFVPGSPGTRTCSGLFGAAAERVVVDAIASCPSMSLGEQGVLLALAATAYHAVPAVRLPELIIGHGVLGRLLARMVVALGGEAPTVWETQPAARRCPRATGHRPG